ncbi:unnamed protein product, partial [Polarella glacialis]
LEPRGRRLRIVAASPAALGDREPRRRVERGPDLTAARVASSPRIVSSARDYGTPRKREQFVVRRGLHSRDFSDAVGSTRSVAASSSSLPRARLVARPREAESAPPVLVRNRPVRLVSSGAAQVDARASGAAQVDARAPLQRAEGRPAALRGRQANKPLPRRSPGGAPQETDAVFVSERGAPSRMGESSGCSRATLLVPRSRNVVPRVPDLKGRQRAQVVPRVPDPKGTQRALPSEDAEGRREREWRVKGAELRQEVGMMRKEKEEFRRQMDLMTQTARDQRAKDDEFRRQEDELQQGTEEVKQQQNALTQKKAELERKRQEMLLQEAALKQEEEALQLHTADLERQTGERDERQAVFAREKEVFQAGAAELAKRATTVERREEELRLLMEEMEDVVKPRAPLQRSRAKSDSPQTRHDAVKATDEEEGDEAVTDGNFAAASRS